MTIEAHEIANLFPLLGGKEFEEFKEDIRKNGLKVPITIYEGKILDGRNRYRACVEVGVPPVFIAYEGSDPVGHSWSLNYTLRHLNKSQKALARVRASEWRGRGRGPSNPRLTRITSQPEAAKELGVGLRTLQSAVTVVDKGTPEQIAEVAEGKTSVETMEKIIRGKRKPAIIGKRRGIRNNKDAPYVPDSPRQKVVANAQKNRMIEVLRRIGGSSSGLMELDVKMTVSVCTKEEILEWAKSASESAIRLNRLARKLREEI